MPVKNQSQQVWVYRAWQMLKWQLIKAINADLMTAEIIKELAMLRKTNDSTSKYALTCKKRIKEQRVQKEMLSSMQESKVFDIVKCARQCTEYLSSSQTDKTKSRYQYWGPTHDPKRYPGFGNRCTACGWENHFEKVAETQTEEHYKRYPKLMEGTSWNTPR